MACTVRAKLVFLILLGAYVPALIAGEAYGPDSIDIDPVYPDLSHPASSPREAARVSKRRHARKTRAKHSNLRRQSKSSTTRQRRSARHKRSRAVRRKPRAKSRAKPRSKRKVAHWTRLWKAKSKPLLNKSSVLRLQGKHHRHGKRLLLKGNKTTKHNGAGTLATFVSMIAKQPKQTIPSFLTEFKQTMVGHLNRAASSETSDSPSDYLPGYFSQPVYTRLGKSFISLYPVAIQRHGSTRAYRSTLSLYRHYKGQQSQPDSRLPGQAAVYINNKRILYRWIADFSAAKTHGILGLDILLQRFSKHDFSQTRTISVPAQLYFLNKGRARVKSIRLNIKLAKAIEIR